MINTLFTTIQYSNAVMVALLPHITDYAHKLNLDTDIPITPTMIQKFACVPFANDPGGYVVLTNGLEFWFNHGFVSGFARPGCYYHLQDPHEIPKYYGELRINEDDAIRIARRGLEMLGYNLTNIFADQVPVVIPPPSKDGHLIPVYRVE